MCRWYAPAAISLQTKTFDELVSSGRLNLISDAKLRELLLDAHNRHDTATADFTILTKPMQEKAQLLEEFLFWYPAREEVVEIHTDDNSGTYCEADIKAIKQSKRARSILAQLYRSQLIYHDFRQDQARSISGIIAYMEDKELVSPSKENAS